MRPPTIGISTTSRTTGFRDYWVSSVIDDMRATGAQGVFADSFEAGISGYGVTDPDTRFDGTNPANAAMWANGDTWTAQKHEWSAYVEQAFAATPEHFLFVPNIGAMITGWSDVDYSNIDGAMLEGFAYMEAPADWVLGMNRAMKLTARANSSSCSRIRAARRSSTSTSATSCSARTICSKARTRTSTSPAAASIGSPSTTSTSARRRARCPRTCHLAWQWRVRRDFAKGIVLVNPSTASVTVTLPRPTAGAAERRRAHRRRAARRRRRLQRRQRRLRERHVGDARVADGGAVVESVTRDE